MFKSSASAINFDKTNIVGSEESERCSGCGKPLYWHGEQSDNDIICYGWHRMIYAQNSYVENLCNECCQEHLNNILEQ
jgi:hypothetical protein